MREKLMLSGAAYPADVQRALTEMEKFYKGAVRDSRFEAASGLSEEQDEVIRTLNILALIGKNTVQNTETEKLYFAYLTEQDEAKKAALKERYIAALRGYGTEEKERDSRLALWIGESDSKTCNECQSLKGTTYKPEDVPDLPHPNCRCEVRYVTWGAEKRKEGAATTAVMASTITSTATTSTDTAVNANTLLRLKNAKPLSVEPSSAPFLAKGKVDAVDAISSAAKTSNIMTRKVDAISLKESNIPSVISIPTDLRPIFEALSAGEKQQMEELAVVARSFDLKAYAKEHGFRIVTSQTVRYMGLKAVRKLFFMSVELYAEVLSTKILIKSIVSLSSLGIGGGIAAASLAPMVAVQAGEIGIDGLMLILAFWETIQHGGFQQTVVSLIDTDSVILDFILNSGLSFAYITPLDKEE